MGHFTYQKVFCDTVFCCLSHILLANQKNTCFLSPGNVTPSSYDVVQLIDLLYNLLSQNVSINLRLTIHCKISIKPVSLSDLFVPLLLGNSEQQTDHCVIRCQSEVCGKPQQDVFIVCHLSEIK